MRTALEAAINVHVHVQCGPAMVEEEVHTETRMIGGDAYFAKFGYVE